MDKSLGTNLHLQRFFTRAKQIHLHLFSPSPLQCWTRVPAISPEFQRCIGGWGWGWGGEKQRILKRITVLFLRLRFKNTEN